MKLKSTKTIRFKLTMWYSGLLMLLTLVLIITINIVIGNHLKNDPVEDFRENGMRPPPMSQYWDELDEEHRAIVREYRQKDLETLRRVSILAFIPFTALSVAGGYLIAGQMLKPLRKINSAMGEVNARNLKPISHDDTGDELSELIENFNKMVVRLDRSFESQSQFVENASHELKTPLAIVQTNLDAATTDQKISKEEMSALINTALKSTEFMNKLIEDLLLLAVLENDIEKEPTRFADIVSESVSQLQDQAKKNNVKLEIKIDKTVKAAKVTVNPTLIQRAIMNIIENAIKHSSKGEAVKVRMMRKKSPKNSGMLTLEIADRGPGIPKSEQKKIFERFYRIDKSRSRKSGGAGLGLAITKKIVDAHSGDIKVSSSKKAGTKFTIELPISKKENSKK